MSQYHLIYQELQKVINSQCFSKSVVLKELFKHLVEKSIKGEEPIEHEIAYEIFGKKPDSEKEKNIRIYVFNLRKKLKEYYDKEGQNDKVIFSIPKGAYEVKTQINKKILWKTRMTKLAPGLFIASLLVCLISFLLSNQKQRPEITRHFIWSNIYESEHPLLMVLGDHYFVMARNTLGNMGITRYTHINSDEEFEQLLHEHTEFENDFDRSSQTYINKQAPLVMYRILSFLGGNQIKIDMRYSSDLEWEHLENNNTLFIGSYKTQGILKDIFEEIGIEFNAKNTRVSYTHADSTTVYFPDSEQFLRKEYASLIHFKTKDNKIVMALMCNTDIGNIASIKYLTSAKNLKDLHQLTSSYTNQNFKAIFEVNGQNQTDFRTTLVRIDPIEIDINELWP